MFAGISNYIWGNAGNEEPSDTKNDNPVDSTSVRSTSNRNISKKSSKSSSLKKSKALESAAVVSTATSDSGDESDSWVLVEEPSKSTKCTPSGRNHSSTAVASTTGSRYTGHGNVNASGKSSSSTGRNGMSKVLSRRSTTRVLVSSNSQVPVKVAPVRKPLRRHRQVSEQSLEEFPSLANDDHPLGSNCKGDPSQLTTYAQVLATANSTSSDESSSNTSTVRKQVNLVAVDSTALVHETTSSSSSSLPSPLPLVDTTFKMKPVTLVIDAATSSKTEQSTKKKGTGSPKSKKSRRHEATDEEWFVTPPPCFTRPNTFDMVKSPIEDMLIEQPIPSTNTPSTPSSIELDSCSLSSRESSVEDRGRMAHSSNDDEKENLNKKENVQQQKDVEGGVKLTCSSLEFTPPTPIAFTPLQGQVEGKEEKEISPLVPKKRDIKLKSENTSHSHSQSVVSNAKCKSSTSKLSAADTAASSSSVSPSSCIIPDGARKGKQLSVSTSAVAEGRKEEEEETEGEEENNENWQSPVVKARQRLNSKGRLALDTYTVVSRKERRKKKKNSSKCNGNNVNSNNDGTSGSNDGGKNCNHHWSRPSWSDASVVNGTSAADNVASSTAASFAPSLKLMLKAVNRAQQQKLQWITNCNDSVQCKSGPVRRKDKFASRPHSFCLNRKTNRNF